jgi:YfiH family protein
MADAMITDLAGLALLVKQADCQAVILYDPLRNVISNVHCGWRGNVNGLLSAVIVVMRQEFGCDPSLLRAAIGPSLGPCCAEFITHQEIFPESFRSFMIQDNYFDLRAISRSQLVQSGLKDEHIESADCCTRCRTDLFYSYRGEGHTGRFATVVMLKP